MGALEEEAERCIGAGEVQRKVRTWEIHILHTTATRHLKELCQLYLQMPPGRLKEQIGDAIINGSSPAEQITELISGTQERSPAESSGSVGSSSIADGSHSTPGSPPDCRRGDLTVGTNHSAPSSPVRLPNADDAADDGEGIGGRDHQDDGGKRGEDHALEVAIVLSNEPASETASDSSAESDGADRSDQAVNEGGDEPVNGPAEEPAGDLATDRSATFDSALTTELERLLQTHQLPAVQELLTRQLPWQGVLSELVRLLSALSASHRPAGTPPPTARPSRPKPSSRPTCFNCDRKGHIVKYCPYKVTRQRKNNK